MAAADTPDRQRWQNSRWWRTAALLLPWVFAARFADAVRWVRAGDLSAQGRFEEALRVARSMRALFRQDMEWAVFEIQQLALLHWDLETIDAVNHFLLMYEYPTAKSDDRKYLLAYVKWCGASAFARYAVESPMPSAFEFDASKIVLSSVRAGYKRLYPLTIHPSWSKTSPFYPNNRISKRTPSRTVLPPKPPRETA